MRLPFIYFRQRFLIHTWTINLTDTINSWPTIVQFFSSFPNLIISLDHFSLSLSLCLFLKSVSTCSRFYDLLLCMFSNVLCDTRMNKCILEFWWSNIWKKLDSRTLLGTFSEENQWVAEMHFRRSLQDNDNNQDSTKNSTCNDFVVKAF